jgi:hypothetical protein
MNNNIFSSGNEGFHWKHTFQWNNKNLRRINKKRSNFYEVKFILLAILNGAGMIVCRTKETGFLWLIRCSSGNEGCFCLLYVIHYINQKIINQNRHIYILINQSIFCVRFGGEKLRIDVSPISRNQVTKLDSGNCSKKFLRVIRK